MWYKDDLLPWRRSFVPTKTVKGEGLSCPFWCCWCQLFLIQRQLSESVVCEAANGAVAPTGDPPLGGGGLSLCYVNPHRNVQFPARAGYFLKPLQATHWHPSCSQHSGHCQQLEQSEKNRKTPDHMLPGNNMVPVAHRGKPLRIFELYVNSYSAAVGQMRMH